MLLKLDFSERFGIGGSWAWVHCAFYFLFRFCTLDVCCRAVPRCWQLPLMGWVTACHLRREMSGSSLVPETTARPIVPGEAQTHRVTPHRLAAVLDRLHSSLLVRLVFGAVAQPWWYIYSLCSVSTICMMPCWMQGRLSDADRR